MKGKLTIGSHRVCRIFKKTSSSVVDFKVKFKILFLIIVCPILIHCGIRRTRLPSKLLDCMKAKTREDGTVSDEEISTSCLLEFMWLKGKKCDKTSPGTADWLEFLIKQGLIIDKQGRRRKRAVNGRLGLRKEYRMLSDKERRDYHNAINAMKNDKSVLPNKYDALVKYHQMASLGAHGGPAFLAWHRFFLVLYELALQEQNPNVMLPYWDSSLDNAMRNPADSVIWTSEFFGDGRGSIDSGPFAGWVYNDKKITRSINTFGRLMNKKRVDKLVRTDRGQSYFVNSLEQQHNVVHVWVGGNMLNIFRSPSDPVFFMHHANIDCIWEEYRQRQIDNGNDPTRYPPPVRRSQRPHHNADRFMDLPNLFDKKIRNRDGYLNFWTEDFYRCDPRPWCSNTKPDCGSKWLQCDLFLKQCVSKGSVAIHSEITPEKVLQISEQVAPEPAEPKTNKRRNNDDPSTPHIPESDEVVESAKSVSTDKFFEILDEIPKQEPKPKNKPAPAPGNSRQDIEPQNSKSTIAPSKSILDFVLPDSENSCSAFPTQNTFALDCQTSSDLWVFVPVKVVHLRRGDIVYDAHPVNSNGQLDKKVDIFSMGNPLRFSSNWKSQSDSKDRKCKIDKSGLTKVKIVSYGLNYNGFYEDNVFIDNRQSVSSAVSYIAVKKPDSEGSSVFVSAVDECGIACQPMIIRRQRRGQFPQYRKFSGSALLTADQPSYHSKTYRGAESLVWKNQGVPYEDYNQIPIIFYCSYSDQTPWV